MSQAQSQMNRPKRRYSLPMGAKERRGGRVRLVKNLQQLVENCIKLRQNVLRSDWVADHCGRKPGRGRSGKSRRRLRKIDQPAHDLAIFPIILLITKGVSDNGSFRSAFRSLK